MEKGPCVDDNLKTGSTRLKTARTTSAITPAMIAAGSTCTVSIFLFGRNLYKAKIVTTNRHVIVVRITVNLAALRTMSSGMYAIIACSPVLMATNKSARAEQARVSVNPTI